MWSIFPIQWNLDIMFLWGPKFFNVTLKLTLYRGWNTWASMGRAKSFSTLYQEKTLNRGTLYRGFTVVRTVFLLPTWCFENDFMNFRRKAVWTECANFRWHPPYDFQPVLGIGWQMLRDGKRGEITLASWQQWNALNEASCPSEEIIRTKPILFGINVLPFSGCKM
jgi:hypothetical protein